LIGTCCFVRDTSVRVNLFECYCRQVYFMVIGIHTFIDVRAVSFPVDPSSLLLTTLSRLSLLGSFLCCFSAVDNLTSSLGVSRSRTFVSSGSMLCS
jgi:hypothetical protein